jgi:hypothetical protein
MSCRGCQKHRLFAEAHHRSAFLTTPKVFTCQLWKHQMKRQMRSSITQKLRARAKTRASFVGSQPAEPLMRPGYLGNRFCHLESCFGEAQLVSLGC